MAIELERETSQGRLMDILTGHRLRNLSPRVERLYHLLQKRMTQPQQPWGEELTVLDEPETHQLPFVLRRARAAEKVLLEIPVAIEEDDLLVGNNIVNGAIARVRLPRFATDEERQEAREKGIKINTGVSHKFPYYFDVLQKGLSGIMAGIDYKIKSISARPRSDAQAEKVAMFQAMHKECSAVIAMAHRYARLAEELAEQAATPERRGELLKIARVCRRVPELPAETLGEAMQSFWFLNYALYSTQTNISCGRLDQLFYPALVSDLEAGTITLDEAQELVDCLFLRFNDRAQICRENFFSTGSCKTAEGKEWSYSLGKVVADCPREWEAGHRKRSFMPEDGGDAINHWGQNVLISGIRPDGTDGTNPLTYMFLNAAEKLSLTSPVLSVRLHRKSPPELVRRVAEVLKGGGGMPYIDNDDVIIKAYTELGIPLADARDYANSNCWETMIQGKSDQELVRGINFLLYLELALNRGTSHVHGKTGPDTGDPRDFTSFTELMAAWKAQTDCQLKQAIDYIGSHVTNGTLEHSRHGKYSHNPLISALTLDCIEKERDITRRGARYTIWHLMAEGIASTIDSMAAIKQLVFEEKSLSMAEILSALEADWKGYENLRQRILHRIPKFANDSDYADDIGRELMSYFVERSRLHAARWYPTVIFPRSVGTFSWIISIGREVAATPDGRHSGEPVAANLSPAPGADISGPTAAINSYAKMYPAELAAGAPIDLRLSRAGLQDDAGTERLGALIKTFINLGGNMITLTVTDIEELKRAMQEPEKYRQLRVRMGGWSAYFVMLCKEQQLLHIRRVEHGMA